MLRAILFSVALCLVVLGCESAEDVDRANKRDAAPIIAALDVYNKENGKYPDTLSQLVPKYLQTVRKPKSAEGWHYWTENQAQQFKLGYHGDGEHYTSYYWSRAKKWQTDTK
jgi:hypothetical protein